MTKDEQWLLDEKYGGKETVEYEADKKRLVSGRPFGKSLPFRSPDAGDAGEPLGYIIGWQPFLGLKIYLDSKPLIPRTETEWWTEQLLADLVGREPMEWKMGVRLCQAARSDPIFHSIGERPLQFLDLCAGSGAIGCAVLSKLPHAQVYFGEIDSVHEATIAKNIRENNLDASRADIRIGDLFEPFGDMQFDIIATNPPYIPNDHVLPESVALYEPERALYAGIDGLDIIRRIKEKLPKHLARGGEAWIECDSHQTEAIQELFVAQGLSAEIRKDQYATPRIIVVSFP
jgi:release factor glutamine methyltransferase